jgi:hypothetical protein
MSLVQSAANGDSITINETGQYMIVYTDQFNVGAWIGLSKNSTQLTTSINSITAANVMAINITVGDSYGNVAAAILKLTASDVIRCHTTGAPSGGNTACEIFRIAQTAKY